jgi:hypothetical protein
MVAAGAENGRDYAFGQKHCSCQRRCRGNHIHSVECKSFNHIGASYLLLVAFRALSGPSMQLLYKQSQAPNAIRKYHFSFPDSFDSSEELRPISESGPFRLPPP